MDRVSLHGQKPLQIRSGHTPVNVGLMVGSLIASVPAMLAESTRSHSVSEVLPPWAAYVFYAVLLLGSAMTLSGIATPLPTELNPVTYHVIVSRLVRERIGHYAVAGIMLCFAAASFATNGMQGLAGAGWLLGVAIGLVFRARQTSVDVEKLHVAMRAGSEVCADVVADPDDDA